MFKRLLVTQIICLVVVGDVQALFASALENSNNELEYCVDEHMIEQRRLVTLDKRAKQRSKFRIDRLSKQAVLIDVSKVTEPIVGTYSLSIDLNAIHVKSYLKNEKLVLVGDGFNDEALMDVAYDLEFKGFRDVKVLANGRRSLALRNADKNAYQATANKLHFVDAVTALSAAATSSLKNEYSFLMVGADITQLSDYGIDHSAILGGEEQDISEMLGSRVDEILKQNPRKKLVLVLRNGDQKKHILANDKLTIIPGLWVLNGESNALLSAINNTKIAPVRLRNHKYACRTR